jgi:hypothetical protein
LRRIYAQQIVVKPLYNRTCGIASKKGTTRLTFNLAVTFTVKPVSKVAALVLLCLICLGSQVFFESKKAMCENCTLLLFS